MAQLGGMRLHSAPHFNSDAPPTCIIKAFIVGKQSLYGVFRNLVHEEAIWHAMLLTRDIVTPTDKIKTSQSPKDCKYICRRVTRATAHWSSVSEPPEVDQCFMQVQTERHNQIRLPVEEKPVWHPKAYASMMI